MSDCAALHIGKDAENQINIVEASDIVWKLDIWIHPGNSEAKAGALFWFLSNTFSWLSWNLPKTWVWIKKPKLKDFLKNYYHSVMFFKKPIREYRTTLFRIQIITETGVFDENWLVFKEFNMAMYKELWFGQRGKMSAFSSLIKLIYCKCSSWLLFSLQIVHGDL